MPSLSGVLRTLQHQDNLAVFDLGHDWTAITWADDPPCVSPNPGWIDRARALLRPAATAPAPFAGGLVGWLGYEAGRFVERMPDPVSPACTPDLHLWRCDGGLCLHRPTGRWHIHGTDAFTAEARGVLQQAGDAPRSPAQPQPWRPEQRTHSARYQDGVREILAAISAGDVYQANLAWEQQGIPTADPLARWLGLRAANPAERGAFLRCGETTVVSNSPELYLQVSAAGHLLSVPIKGTARAAAGDAERLRLWRSEKERAELTMIVDLVRNDLGRVAQTGSVQAAPRQLRRCGDLLHAEQAVSARLREGTDAFDAVAASFPPGSVTGAPKVSAMEIIHRLEGAPRGIYTGALGFFGDDGAAHLSVAIRTAIVQGGRSRFHVGAGIVADSEPALEWRETLAKGRALAGWLGAR